MCSHARSGDNDFDTSVFGTFGEGFDFLRSAVSGKRVHFERDFHLVEEFRRFFHDGQVRGAAHDDANDWSHNNIELIIEN